MFLGEVFVVEKMYGYVRVSTKEQNENRQLDAMSEMHVPRQNIYIDKQSGKNFNRPQYRRLMQRLQVNDVLYIKSIDRLGRNYEEILDQWRELTRTKKVNIVVIDMPILNTQGENDLMKTFVSDIVLQILSFVAENERKNIRQRQAEGIASAKARGIQFGRPAKELPDDFDEAVYRYQEGELTLREASERCDMPLSSFYYRMNKK